MQSAPPRGDDAAVQETARLLVAAENPVIVADRAARTPAGLALMVELAEALQAPVIDMYGRMNFPWRHPLNQTRRRRKNRWQADVILGLELTDFWGVTNGRLAPGAKRISITAGDLYMKSNYQDFERFTPVDIAIAADAETTLPYLIEAVRKAHTPAAAPYSRPGARSWQGSPGRTGAIPGRPRRSAGMLNPSRLRGCVRKFTSRFATRTGRSATARCSRTTGRNNCGPRLNTINTSVMPVPMDWDTSRAPAVGAALAHRKHGRLAVAIGGDGDLMFTPGALWTAAHHRIPLLYVVHNNRAYHQEVMYVQMMANKRNRGIDRAHMGNAITDPNVDFSKLAAGMGVYAEGADYGSEGSRTGAQRAIAVVKRGEPALVDVISQGR